MTSRPDVLFAVMPFGDVSRPALGASLLAAAAKRDGFAAAVRYFHLDLAAEIGLDEYGWLAQTRPGAWPGAWNDPGLDPTLVNRALMGEWIFARFAFPERRDASLDYAHACLGGDRALLERLVRVQERAGTFLARCAREVIERAPRVVGFTTSFQQTAACLALARLLRDAPGPPLVVFGGANCEGPMGRQMLRSFPWIDAVCTGEGDEAFPRFLASRLGGGTAPVPGMLERSVLDATPPPPVHALDALPIPDFDDYFGALAASPLAGSIAAKLPLETARGCWWGAKHHCTFCGLNGGGMVYRSKSPARALAEIRTLHARHGVRQVELVDNILDVRYPGTVFEELARSGEALDIFCEIKSNLRWEHLDAMRRGGVREVQPGIESFGDATLAIMRKGTTGLQNVQLLRWCAELDIDPGWNIIYGFPGEPAEESARVAALVPALAHLKPPSLCTRLRLDRFSPLFEQAESAGLRNVRPFAAYAHVFPLPPDELRELAYHFEFDYADGRDPDAYAAPLVAATRAWTEGALSDTPPRLDAIMAGDVCLVTDTRPVASAPVHVLRGPARDVLLACDRVQTRTRLARELGPGAEAAVDELRTRRLIIEDGDRLIAAPVLRNRP